MELKMSVQVASGGPTIEELAWLAGYFDGDGCVTMSSASGRSTRFRYPRLTIDSCDLELLEEVKRITGVTRIKTKTPSKISDRNCYTLVVDGSRAVRLLVLIEPFMRCAFKKDRAKLLIDNLSLYTRGKGTFFTEYEAEKRFSIEKQFFELGGNRGSRNRACASKLSVCNRGELLPP